MRIELRNGTVYQVAAFQFGNDSSAVLPEGEYKSLMIDNRNIASISTANHTLGAFQGFLLGALGGIAAGVIVTPSPDRSESGARYWNHTLSIAAWSFLGGMVGLTLGAVKGDEMIYLLQQTAEHGK